MREDRKQHSGANVIHKSDGESVNFEQAILLTGHGRYNSSLLLVCGLILTLCGCQSSLSAYIIPSAQCDLRLSSNEMGFLNAAFLIGATIGAALSGAIADAIGRRKLLIWSLFIDGCVALLSSLSQNFPALFISFCLNGLILGGPFTIILLFYGEFYADKSRAKAVCYLGFFWAVSMVLLPALAWIVIPLKFDIVLHGFVFNSWRLYVGIFGLPCFLGAFLLSRYPETPKYLFSQGQNENALEIMREMFVSNTKQEARNYPVKTLTSEYPIPQNEVSRTLSSTLRKMWEQICCLFSPALRKCTFLTASILFANMFGFYGLGLWLPELFNRFENYHKLHPNVTITVCELAYLQQESTMTVQLSADNGTKICDGSVDAQAFVNTIITGLSCLSGILASGYLANRWERRVMPIATMLISGIGGCVIYFLRTSMQNLIASCIFSAFVSMANITIYSVIIDVFPTNVNAIAANVVSVIGRLGAILSNIFFGTLLDISCEVPIFLVGGIVILGGLLGFLLPKHPIALPGTLRTKKLSVTG